MQAQLDELRHKIAELQAHPTTQNNINILIINNFGQEDTSYIPLETLQRRYLAKSPGVVETIRDVHMNPDHPENNNVKMVSRRRNIAAYRNNGKWQNEPTSVIVDKLIWNGFSINMRCQTIHDNPDEMTDADANRLLEFQDWVTDMYKAKQQQNIQKRHVVTVRQQVRSMLLDSQPDEGPPSDPSTTSR